MLIKREIVNDEPIFLDEEPNIGAEIAGIWMIGENLKVSDPPFFRGLRCSKRKPLRSTTNGRHLEMLSTSNLHVLQVSAPLPLF